MTIPDESLTQTMDDSMPAQARQPSIEGTDDQLRRLQEEEQTLQKAIEVQTMRKKVADLRKQLANPGTEEMSIDSSDQAADAELAQTSNLTGTRQREDGSSTTVTRPIRFLAKVPAPEKYMGKSIKQHRKFMRTYNLTFRSDPEYYRHDTTKILYAMQLLDGEPTETWARHEEEVGQDITT